MPDLSKLSEQEFEDLCDGCGKCCEISDSGVACPGLDTETNRCTVYAARLTTHVCTKLTPQNVKTLHQKRVLPDSCAYVRYYRGQEPLQRPVTSAVLIPYAGMPKRFKRWYDRSNREFQAGLPFTRPTPPRIATKGLSRPRTDDQTLFRARPLEPARERRELEAHRRLLARLAEQR